VKNGWAAKARESVHLVVIPLPGEYRSRGSIAMEGMGHMYALPGSYDPFGLVTVEFRHRTSKRRNLLTLATSARALTDIPTSKRTFSRTRAAAFPSTGASGIRHCSLGIIHYI